MSVPAGGKVTSTVTDAYTPNAGSLVVNKTIAGAGAGQQGPITITVTCIAQREHDDAGPRHHHPGRRDERPAAHLHRYPRRLGVHSHRGPGRSHRQR